MRYNIDKFLTSLLFIYFYAGSVIPLAKADYYVAGLDEKTQFFLNKTFVPGPLCRRMCGIIHIQQDLRKNFKFPEGIFAST
jgi:hypothetical protein